MLAEHRASCGLYRHGQNRFALNFDYYNKLTDDLLSDVNLPTSAGFSSFKGNVGQVENRGFELGANAYLIRDTKPIENGRILSCTRLAFLQIFCLGKQPGSQAAAGLDAHFLHFILARDHIAAHFFEPLGGQFFQLVVHQIEA